MKQFISFVLIACITVSLFGCRTNANQNVAPYNPTNLPLDKIRLPHGFRIAVYGVVPNARSLALGDKGTVFVSNLNQDKVYALVDTNHDGIADKRYIIVQGFSSPNGVAFHNGSLYIAGIDKIWRIDNIENDLAHPAAPVLVYSGFSSNVHHGWKYIAFGPDGKLYVPVGAPCNDCDSAANDPRYGTITRMNADGSGFEIYASGIRNSVGFDWDPRTKDLWFTDNGVDQLGDDIPSDELNHAPAQGMNFGFPFCHEGDISDPTYGSQHPCSDFTPPVQKLGPHVAALGMKFYTGSMFPPSYRNQVFIAEHGSTSRTTPIGYRVCIVRLDGNKSAGYEVFADGWLQNGDAWGRPVALLQLKDGSLLVSDDRAGVVYRITYDNF